MTGIIFPILLGYALGSFLPAYFLGKWLADKDIRTLGDKNPGTTNVKRSLGFYPAALTASYDTTKGLVAMAVAAHVFQSPQPVVYASGASAILGHVFPFYLGFRGGRGAATATGILILMLAKTALAIPFAALGADLAYMAFVVASVYWATRNENFLALTALPTLAALLAFRLPSSPDRLFLFILIIYLFVVSLMGAEKIKILTIQDENLRLWRVFIRPAAMAFPLLGLFLNRLSLLILVGSVLALSFLADVARLTVKKAQQLSTQELLAGVKIYKQAEARQVSSITIFLLGVFLSFLLFRQEIAIACTGFLIFGDMMAKIIGISYGKRLMFAGNQKTLEGFLGFWSASVSVSYFLWLAGVLPIGIGLVGALVAAAVESLPLSVNDNLSVPIISGSIMSLLVNAMV